MADWVTINGGRAAFEVSPEAIYLVIGLRNAGSGIAVLHGWYFYPERLSGTDHAKTEDFRRLTRDLYVPAGDIGVWQCRSEWEYWTMGEPVDETTLINRALLAGFGLRVDVLPAGEEERHRQDENDTGIGAQFEQRL
jgi:hypothetical protein